VALSRIVLGTVLLVSISNSSLGSWKSKPPEQWTIGDVAELLDRSPWANLVMITVLYESRPVHSFIRFCWLAEPIDLAIQQVRSRNLRIDPLGYNPFQYDPFYFYQFYDSAMKLQTAKQPGAARPVYILVQGNLLADLIEQEGRENMEKAYPSSPVANLRVSRFFYGIQRLVYQRDERGIAGARVGVGTLKRGKPAGTRKLPPVDERPPGRAVYEFQPDFPENQEVSALLMVFDRAQIEKMILDENTEKITAIIPFGNTTGR
jgi:hypothetical protein